MKVTTPQEKPFLDPAQVLISKFEEVLSKIKRETSEYNLSIYEYSTVSQREEIERVYTEAGWKNVDCKHTESTSDYVETTTLHLEY